MSQVKYSFQHLIVALVNHLAMRNIHVTKALAVLWYYAADLTVFNLVYTLRKHHSAYWCSVDKDGTLLVGGTNENDLIFNGYNETLKTCQHEGS